jgi:hypothetical protein
MSNYFLLNQVAVIKHSLVNYLSSYLPNFIIFI